MILEAHASFFGTQLGFGRGLNQKLKFLCLKNVYLSGALSKQMKLSVPQPLDDLSNFLGKNGSFNAI